MSSSSNISNQSQLKPSAPAPTVTTASAPDKPDTLSQNLAEVRRAGNWVLHLISLFTLGLPAYIGKLIEPVLDFWDIFAITAPLTIAIAVIGVSLIRKWFDEGLGYLWFAAGTVVGTSWIGNRVFDAPGWIDIWKITGSYRIHPILLPLAFLWEYSKNYYYLYGNGRFASSLVIGSFLAWVWGKKVLPHL
jgi:hypothetical protein